MTNTELESLLETARAHALSEDETALWSGDNLVDMGGALKQAEARVSSVGEDISAQVDEIKRAGYEHTLPVLLSNANSHAVNDGNTPLFYGTHATTIMDDLLGTAEECASYLKREDATAQVEEIRRKGYEHRLPQILDEARGYAKCEDIEVISVIGIGNVGELDKALELAEKAAKYLKKDISAQVKEIRDQGYENGLKVALDQARSYAQIGEQPDRPGGPVDAEIALGVAQKCATYLKRDISAQVAEIKALVKE